ncbi:sigma factor-like helix-turn-helix DNA-binding protein, partial [Streptomyces sp. NPDC002920]
VTKWTTGCSAARLTAWESRVLPRPPGPTTVARAMVVLRYWEDQSVESVAELLKCSESTVKSQCSRSLAKLRAQLGDAHIYTAGS